VQRRARPAARSVLRPRALRHRAGFGGAIRTPRAWHGAWPAACRGAIRTPCAKHGVWPAAWRGAIRTPCAKHGVWPAAWRGGFGFPRCGFPHGHIDGRARPGGRPAVQTSGLHRQSGALHYEQGATWSLALRGLWGRSLAGPAHDCDCTSGRAYPGSRSRVVQAKWCKPGVAGVAPSTNGPQPPPAAWAPDAESGRYIPAWRGMRA
jgi:hypothetical protein